MIIGAYILAKAPTPRRNCKPWDTGVAKMHHMDCMLIKMVSENRVRRN